MLARWRPPFFVSNFLNFLNLIDSNIFIEKRHADQLSKPSLDEESRLEVIYRILKD